MNNSWVGQQWTNRPITLTKKATELGRFVDCEEFKKSRLARISSDLIAVPPTRLADGSPSPWAATVWKPDLGSGGVRQVQLDARICKHMIPGDWVMQPFVGGIELRVTAVETGEKFVSLLLARHPNGQSTWRPLRVTTEPRLVAAVELLRRRFGIERLGCDIKLHGRYCWLLDANPDPDVALHSSDPTVH
jgi:hypothetical protein